MERFVVIMFMFVLTVAVLAIAAIPDDVDGCSEKARIPVCSGESAKQSKQIDGISPGLSQYTAKSLDEDLNTVSGLAFFDKDRMSSQSLAPDAFCCERR